MPEDRNGSSGYDREWRNHVNIGLGRLEGLMEGFHEALDGLQKRLEQMDHKLDALSRQVWFLSGKAAVYGALAGLLITILMQLIFRFAFPGQ